MQYGLSDMTRVPFSSLDFSFWDVYFIWNILKKNIILFYLLSYFIVF